MIRILTALSAFVLLTGAQCSRAEIDRVESLILGDPPAVEAVQFVAMEQAFIEAGEDESVAEIVQEPEVIVPPCVDYLNRGQWFSCDGTWLRDL